MVFGRLFMDWSEVSLQGAQSSRLGNHAHLLVGIWISDSGLE